MVVPSGNFFFVTIWGLFSFLNAVDLATFLSFDATPTLSIILSRSWYTGTSAEQHTKLVAHFVDDQHNELHGERKQFLRPPSFPHCVNSF